MQVHRQALRIAPVRPAAALVLTALLLNLKVQRPKQSRRLRAVIQAQKAAATSK